MCVGVSGRKQKELDAANALQQVRARACVCVRVLCLFCVRFVCGL